MNSLKQNANRCTNIKSTLRHINSYITTCFDILQIVFRELYTTQTYIKYMNYQIDEIFLVFKVVDIIKFVVEAGCIIHTCPLLLLTSILGIYETRILKA